MSRGLRVIRRYGTFRNLCLTLVAVSLIIMVCRYGTHTPDFYKNYTRPLTAYQGFIERCKAVIPEHDSVLILQEPKVGFANYYLYPRKVYLLPEEGKRSTEKKTAFIREHKIQWLIEYNDVDKFDPATARIEKVN